MFGCQGKVVETGLFDFTLEEGVVSTGVPATEEQMGLRLGEGIQTARLIGRTVRFPIGLSVSIDGRLTISRIGDGNVHEFGRGCFFDRSADVLGTGAVIATRHPALRLSLGEDDGVEGLSANRLNGEDTTAALGEGGQKDPRFQGLGGEAFSCRRRFSKGSFAV